MAERAAADRNPRPVFREEHHVAQTESRADDRGD